MIQEQRSLQIYDLNKQAKKELEELSHWGLFDKWVREEGGYLALAAIIGWILQMMLSAMPVVCTILKNRMSAGIAALYAVCCFLSHTVQKVRRQAARHRTAVSSPSAESELCMKALYYKGQSVNVSVTDG